MSGENITAILTNDQNKGFSQLGMLIVFGSESHGNQGWGKFLVGSPGNVFTQILMISSKLSGNVLSNEAADLQGIQG